MIFFFEFRFAKCNHYAIRDVKKKKQKKKNISTIENTYCNGWKRYFLGQMLPTSSLQNVV